MSAVIHLYFIDHEFVPWCHGHVDTAPIRISLLMSVIGLLNSDIAAVDVVAKPFESCCIIQNDFVNLVRFLQTPIRYLNRQLHNSLYYGSVDCWGNKNLDSTPVFKSA